MKAPGGGPARIVEEIGSVTGPILLAPRLQAVPPLEQHDPLADDKVVLWPSLRRPLRRDLESLVERWRGWR